MNKCKKSKIFDHVEKRRLSMKAQGLSLNVIIVAAIALIVLIVLWAIFTGRMGQTVTKLEECPTPCISAGACEVVDTAKKGACPDIITLPGGSSAIPVGPSGGRVCCLIEKNIP
jgi:hypothetical protein